MIDFLHDSGIRVMKDVDLRNKRVFIRADLNVPHNESHVVTDDSRIRAFLPTLKYALSEGAAVMVSSHLGRPNTGMFDPRYSLSSVATLLGKLLGREVPLISDWLEGVDVDPGQVVLLENCRFNRGETSDDPVLAEKMSRILDVYVNDAFAVSHRSEATVSALAKCAPVACAGPLMLRELSVLSELLQNPRRPLVAVVGGAKLATKIKIIQFLSSWVDVLIVGGGMANTFLSAAGYHVGASLVSCEFIDVAREVSSNMSTGGGEFPLPVDVVVTEIISNESHGTVKRVEDVLPSDIIVDIGPETRSIFGQFISKAQTIVWNGPMGIFEYDEFSAGTCAIARAIADSPALSIAGGGDTSAAICKSGVEGLIDYVSTGGGAFLSFLEGQIMPGVMALFRTDHS
ncbi:phosphoglycerate kinase [Candidatus Ichthyocystis hellenicum]|uniref:phosphoglycerate kinase n=1 Tax=Candidatus Ichthyocystis hellenicum TaxID=1561003 RepID=UPI000B1C5962|nr:phosphoglycerate kinase [Candidatus Ichthyocystis hellenicum]